MTRHDDDIVAYADVHTGIGGGFVYCVTCGERTDLPTDPECLMALGQDELDARDDADACDYCGGELPRTPRRCRSCGGDPCASWCGAHEY